MENPSEDTQIKQKEGVGPVFGIIIIVALLIMGGVYFLFMQSETAPPELPNADQAGL